MINCEGDQRRREGFDCRERLQVDGRKRKQGKRLEMLMHVVSLASGARHQHKESRISTPIYDSMSKEIMCINQRFAVK